MTANFQLPFVFDLGAVFLFALTGAWVAIRRNYDFIGVFTLALITGVGGGLLRDVVFIQHEHPAVVQDARYIWAVAVASALAALTMPLARRFERLFVSVDALGLGVYVVVGAQKALASGLSLTDSMLVGVINATGGGLMRDIVVREEPMFLKPGQYYVLAALGGALLYTFLVTRSLVPVWNAAWLCIGLIFLLRMLAIHFDWRTAPMPRWGDSD